MSNSSYMLYINTATTNDTKPSYQNDESPERNKEPIEKKKEN